MPWFCVFWGQTIGRILHAPALTNAYPSIQDLTTERLRWREDGKTFGAEGRLVDEGRRQDVRNPIEALTEGSARLLEPP